MKVKCFHCARITYGEGDGDSPLLDGVEEAPGTYQDADVFVCSNCGAVNRVKRTGAEGIERPAVQGADPLTRSAMRDGIISILTSLYPRRTGYNGGLLAPIREPNPDLFMSVLTELEAEGVIEYNDTQIAMRLSDRFIKQNQGVR